MRKNCRKILSLLLALCMSVTYFQITAFADGWNYPPQDDEFWVKSMIIGVPYSANTSIGGSIICEDMNVYSGGGGNYSTGIEKGSFYLPIEATTGYRPHFTFLPGPGMKLVGFAISLYSGTLNIYGDINESEIPSEVYEYGPNNMVLGTIENDGSYTTDLINIPPKSFLEANPGDNKPHFIAAKFVRATPEEIPEKPTNLRWTMGADNNWELNWDAVAGADHYRCEIKATMGTPLEVKITDTNKLVLPADDPASGVLYASAPCLVTVKVSAIKNTVRSEEATSDYLHNEHQGLYKDATHHWYACVICGYNANPVKEVHSYGEWTIDTPATETTPSAKHRECVCGQIENAVIDPTTTPPEPPVSPIYPIYPTYPTTPTTPTTPESTFKDKLVVETVTNGNTATLSWEKIDGADKYIIYQYKNGEWVEAKTTTRLSVNCKNLKNGKDYKYFVRYMKNGELSPESYSCECTVNAYYKPIVKATSTDSYIRLKWEEVPGAEKYAVYKYVNGKAYKLAEIGTHAVRIIKLKPDKEYSYIVRAYVDGKWTTMTKSDIVTIKTKEK